MRCFETMPSSLPESDWRIFREVRQLALTRLCERILDEISRIGSDLTKTPHERYLMIFKVIQERDKTIAYTFNSLSRSVAFLQLLAIQALGLITEEEIGRFSQETRDRVSRAWDDDS